MLQSFFWAAFILLSTPSYSKTISVTIPGDIVANADFRTGEKNKPAVLVLHGFMSTYQLNIVQAMADELENNGYTVLAPTLSLNITNRQGGANCDAIHTHTMASDVVEILWWLEWLNNKGYNNIVVIGHSTGSLQLAILLSNNPPSYITKAILTAPAYLAGPPFDQNTEKKELELAKQMVINKDISLHEFSLSYCKGNFVAPANVFLSYKQWTAEKFIALVEQLTLPYTVILGERDHRFGRHWNANLNMGKGKVRIVPEANHFFDSPAEFDFLDQLNESLNNRK